VQKNRDLTIALRVYPGIAKTFPKDFSFGEKINLIEASLFSLLKACGNLKVKLIVIADSCPKDYYTAINNVTQRFAIDKFQYINVDFASNRDTFIKQVMVLLNERSDYLMFAEDDYLYKDSAITKCIDVMEDNRHIDYITPYDHPDHYSLPIHLPLRGDIPTLSNGIEWRGVGSTTCTFLTRKKILGQDKKDFLSYRKPSLKKNCKYVGSDIHIFLRLTKKTLFRAHLYFFYFLKSTRIGKRIGGDYLAKVLFPNYQVSVPGLKKLIDVWLCDECDLIERLRKKTRTLYAPKANIATHLCKNFIHSQREWLRLYKKLIKELR